MAPGHTTDATRYRWSPHLRGHLLLFDRPPAAVVVPDAGARMLAGAALLEAVRLAAVRWLYPGVPLWLLLSALLGLGLLALPLIAQVDLSQLGFRRWREWTATEKSYFLQVVVIANLVFPIVLAARPEGRG